MAQKSHSANSYLLLAKLSQNRCKTKYKATLYGGKCTAIGFTIIFS